MKALEGYRTYIVAVAVIVAAVASFVAGEATLQEAIITALEGLGLATLRAGVAKV